LIDESLESLIQNNVGGNPEAGTVQRQEQIKELLVGDEIFHFFPFRKVAAFEMVWGFSSAYIYWHG